MVRRNTPPSRPSPAPREVYILEFEMAPDEWERSPTHTYHTLEVATKAAEQNLYPGRRRVARYVAAGEDAIIIERKP